MEDIHYNNLEIIQFVNTPVTSNSFIVINVSIMECIVIDPGSKDAGLIKKYIKENKLNFKYIILTHEHFDHTWGVNDLLNAFPEVKIICTKLCGEWIKTPMNYFNMLYYNSEEYYYINKIDFFIEDLNFLLQWGCEKIKFINTPGHTNKSMCVEISNFLFTGDTLLNGYKPFLKKKYGASIIDLYKSIEFIFNNYSYSAIVFPGHGEKFRLEEAINYYRNYFMDKGIKVKF